VSCSSERGCQDPRASCDTAAQLKRVAGRAPPVQTQRLVVIATNARLSKAMANKLRGCGSCDIAGLDDVRR
jgi:primosomal protein N'